MTGRLAKVDIPFASPDDVQQTFPDERRRALLGRLVRIVEGSAKVGMGAIFPVSAFGFGTPFKLPSRLLPPGSAPGAGGTAD